ncbi:MAG TPA: beta-propeller fold lactonase family protein [Thermoanaerobaculia bacterium]|jgi:DNA-binding beta-propeller fold protein YncE|nr:beta-propeller fold lactonase family protein [Thermoanaerobaculia bacterium]
MKRRPNPIAPILAAGLLLAALPAAAQRGRGVAGAVYVATNAAGNAILAFDRLASGRLDPTPQVYPTGGAGTGTGLGNQGGVILSANERHLFAINAGSDEISVFRVDAHGLTWLSNTPSGGQRPISLTQHGRLLYVLSAGGAVGGQDSIAGFFIGSDGALDPIPGSVQPLSAANTDPAQIGFTPDGGVLVVTEKATNTITTFVVGAGGAAGAPHPQPSVGQTPFGFAFGKRGQLLVSEAFGGAVEASAVTVYFVADDGTLEVLDPSAPTTETAACWLAISNDGRFAYTTNTGSGTLSGFTVGFDGTLTLLDGDGVTGDTGAGTAPIDMDFSTDGRSLYTLNAGTGSLAVFRFAGGSGELSALQQVAGLPDGANGLAAR